MRTRVVALLAAAIVLVAIVGGVALLTGDDDEGDEGSAAGQVAAAVAPQLRYLDGRSSAVLAVDMRYEKQNWSRLRTVASRVLRELRAAQGEDGSELPPNVTGLLNSLTGFAGLSFENDVQPVLDGYLTIGVTLPARRPLPQKLAGLGELLEPGFASYSPRHGGYVSYARGEVGSGPGGASRVSCARVTARLSPRPKALATSGRLAAGRRRPSRGQSSPIARPAAASARSSGRCSRATRPRSSTATRTCGCSTPPAPSSATTPSCSRSAARSARAARRRRGPTSAGRSIARRKAAASRRHGSRGLSAAAGVTTRCPRTGDLTLARILAEEPGLERARRRIPYLSPSATPPRPSTSSRIAPWLSRASARTPRACAPPTCRSRRRARSSSRTSLSWSAPHATRA